MTKREIPGMNPRFWHEKLEEKGLSLTEMGMAQRRTSLGAQFLWIYVHIGIPNRYLNKDVK